MAPSLSFVILTVQETYCDSPDYPNLDTILNIVNKQKNSLFHFDPLQKPEANSSVHLDDIGTRSKDNS